MKRFLQTFLFLVTFLCTQSGFSAAIIRHTGTDISSNAAPSINLATFKVKDYELMTGKKMHLKEKIAFFFAKRALARASKTVDADILQNKVRMDTDDFNIGGFLLGLVFGLLGVLIALLFGNNAFKWALRGFLVWLVLLLLYFVFKK